MLLSGELRVSIMLAESLCRDHTNSARTLICIPIGGEMLEKVGSRIVVIWLGCVLLFSMFLFMTARWACLDYKWHWRIRI